MSKYYYLVAGLPEVKPDDTKLSLSLKEFRQTLTESLPTRDLELVNLIFEKYEAQNWLAYLKNQEAELNPVGNLQRSDFDDILTLLKEDEDSKIKSTPAYFATFAHAFWEEKMLFESLSWEDQLMTLYYENALQCKNKLLHRWFEFNLNIHNLLAAFTCRKFGYDIQTAIVGNNDVATILRTTNARDFGVSDFFEETDLVIRIAEMTDWLERERRIDLLKWQWLEEHTVFEYFTLEVLAVYIIKLQIIERWLPLKKETGETVFQGIIDSLKKDVKLPEIA
ncbi:DUF2764 family protein [Microbacter margulisiae]|uniref:DUF2764 domain-containing protein n=1 Tax=Microbacter margulisiae TaxID=1350067 RepID=A0A7W5H3I1_9PORP|nr:DUF2764 family protein [Microbacter margulisiae]MBB3188614.1 hypothetical protein [Microbacter margulisiae]